MNKLMISAVLVSLCLCCLFFGKDELGVDAEDLRFP